MRAPTGPPGPGMARAVTLPTASGAAASGSGRPRASVGVIVGRRGSPASWSTIARAFGWSLSCATAIRLPPDSLRRRVYVEAVIAKETDERHPKAIGGRDREARWRADGRQDRNACRYGLLHHFVPRASAHREHRSREW